MSYTTMQHKDALILASSMLTMASIGDNTPDAGYAPDPELANELVRNENVQAAETCKVFYHWLNKTYSDGVTFPDPKHAGDSDPETNVGEVIGKVTEIAGNLAPQIEAILNLFRKKSAASAA